MKITYIKGSYRKSLKQIKRGELFMGEYPFEKNVVYMKIDGFKHDAGIYNVINLETGIYYTAKVPDEASFQVVMGELNIYEPYINEES